MDMMDREEQREEPDDVSLRDILTEVKEQDDINSKLRQDFSEACWETVKQYEANPVASNSEYENKINKAENRAIRKRKLKSTKKDTKKAATHTTGPFHFIPNFAANSHQQPFRDPPLQNWFTGVPLYSGMPSTNSGNSKRFQQGACYGCGSMKHWKNRCLFNPKADTKS
ncbi:unnamed protein product [Mytilus coruscus]|uniref:CCHC-type domain-containing protein n=1 Tax=Mytilus coruscus TaxID=42192 RepID=A0A6J8BYD7_MYTCO|nr:unnamed protein product [Mytilus coruscus]